MLRTLLLTIGISSRIRKPINDKRHPNERVPKGGKKERKNSVKSCSHLFRFLCRSGKDLERKEGRKEVFAGSLSFSIKFSRDKGMADRCRKAENRLLAYVAGIIKQEQRVSRLFFFSTRKSRNGVSTFSAIVLPFYKPMRAATET